MEWIALREMEIKEERRKVFASLFYFCGGVLVLFVGVGEIAALDVGDVVTDAVYDLLAQVVIDTQELRLELTVEAQHVVEHEYLTTASATASNADGGNVDGLGDLSGKGCGNLLQNDTEAADFGKHLCIGKQSGGLGLVLGTGRISAELVDALGRQSQVSHYGNTSTQDHLDGSPHFAAPFELHTVSTVSCIMRTALRCASMGSP